MKKRFLSLSVFTVSVLTVGTAFVMAQSYMPQYNNSQQNPASMYDPATTTNYNNGMNTNYNYQNTARPKQVQKPAYNTNAPMNFAPLQGRVTIIPPGVSMPAATMNEISTERIREGDSITLTLNSPFYHNGVMIAPAGSMVSGNAVVAVKAGRAGKHGQLKIKFTSVLTPSGQRIPISGKIATQDGSGLLVGGTGTDRAKKIAGNTAVGAGSGALGGMVMGAVSGGSGHKGAAMGTAIGGGLGLGKSLWQKGRDVIISSGTPIDIEFDQPVTVAPAQAQNQY